MRSTEAQEIDLAALRERLGSRPMLHFDPALPALVYDKLNAIFFALHPVN